MGIIADRYGEEEKRGFPSQCGVLFAPAKSGEKSKIVGRYVIYKDGTVFECLGESGCDFEYIVKDTRLCNVEINGQKLIEHNRKVHGMTDEGGEK